MKFEEAHSEREAGGKGGRRAGMGRPTEKTIKRLFALSGNTCAFPGCASLLVESATTAIGEICHIRAQRQGGPRFDATWPSNDLHDFSNLMLLCPNHHSIVDTQPDVFTAEVLQHMKATQERDAGRPERADDMFSARILMRGLGQIEVSNSNGNVVIASPGAIIGQTVNVTTARRSVKFQPPAGTLGADANASRYILYLINRYNKFASADKDRARPFSHGAISRTIAAKYGAQWRLLPMADFDSLSDYLQTRIAKTRIAKSNAAKGGRSFSTFAEYVQGDRGDG